MRFPGFLGGSTKSQSVIASGERTVNRYMEQIETEGTQSRMALYPSPGFLAFVTGTPVGGRALSSTSGRPFGIVGSQVQEYTNNPPAITVRGTVAVDAHLAQIAYNGPVAAQQFIASGGNGYSYDMATNVLTLQLTGEAHQVGMLNQYFLAFNRTDSKLRISGLDDGTAWDPTDFALRSSQPDPWQAMVVNSPDIWLLGSETGDIWVNKPDLSFPFAPRTGLTIPFGIAAPFSLATIGGSVFWLTRNKAGAGIVVQAAGYDPKPISSSALETAIAGYRRTSTIDDAEAMVFQLEGHTFYALRFPSARATWVFDVTTGKWFEWGKWIAVDNAFDCWAPRVHCDAFGQHLVADASGQISSMDVAYGSEADGTEIRRMRVGPVLIDENQRVEINSFEVLYETGLGVQTGQGSDPMAMCRFSSDGGKTWGNEQWVSLGRAGEYGVRARWLQLGSPRLFVAELTETDPIPRRIVDCFINND